MKIGYGKHGSLLLRSGSPVLGCVAVEEFRIGLVISVTPVCGYGEREWYNLLLTYPNPILISFVSSKLVFVYRG